LDEEDKLVLNRLKKFEFELTRMLAYGRENMDLRPVLTSLVKMLGEEVDYIEKNVTSQVTPAPASGGTVIINGTTVVTSVGAAPVGVIAIINQAVVSGANTITFASPLISAVYGGFLVLSDSEGTLIDSAELRMRSTGMTANQFIYTAPSAGHLYGFAVVAT
jgi:hypothetical protein